MHMVAEVYGSSVLYVPFCCEPHYPKNEVYEKFIHTQTENGKLGFLNWQSNVLLRVVCVSLYPLQSLAWNNRRGSPKTHFCLFKFSE